MVFRLKRDTDNNQSKHEKCVTVLFYQSLKLEAW